MTITAVRDIQDAARPPVQRSALDVAAQRALGAALWIAALATLVFGVPARPAGMVDFLAGAYPAARLVGTHQSIYSPSLAALAATDRASDPGAVFSYPPVYGLLLAPIAALPYERAAYVWYWANVAIIGATALVVALSLPVQAELVLVSGLVAALLAGFDPLRITLGVGQADVLVLFLSACGVAAAQWRGDRTASHARRDVAAGALLGLAAVLKLYPGGLLLYYALRWRYRLVGAAVLAVLGSLLLCLLAIGPSSITDYLLLLQQQNRPGFVAPRWSFGFLAFAYRAFGATPDATPLIALPSWAVLAIAMVWALGAVALAAWAVARRPNVPPLKLAIVTGAVLLAFPKLQLIHLVVLLAVLPEVGLALSGALAAAAVPHRRQLGVALLALAVPLLLPLLDSVYPPATVLRLSILAITSTAVVIFMLLRGAAVPAGTELCLAASGATAALLLIGVHAFQNMSTWGGAHLSRPMVFVAQGQFFLLCLCVASWIWLLRTFPPGRLEGAGTTGCCTLGTEATQRDTR